ncbi:MAG: hypothetical protein RIE59_23515, partial [Imperialibacter sp.]
KNTDHQADDKDLPRKKPSISFASAKKTYKELQIEGKCFHVLFSLFYVGRAVSCFVKPVKS